MSAVAKLAINSRPSVSTAIYLLRPKTFLPATYSLLCHRRLDRLAVDHRGAGALLAGLPFPIQLQWDGTEGSVRTGGTTIKRSAMAGSCLAAELQIWQAISHWRAVTGLMSVSGCSKLLVS